MGVATITAHRVFALRVDPEAITFNYNLITHTESTYGGKVIQILSTNVQGLSLPVMAGAGGREYLAQVVTFFKEMMFWQRDTKQLAYFDYPPRKYHLSVWADSLQIQDALTNVTFPFTMSFKVNNKQDLGVVKSSIVDAEMKKIADGIGYTKNEYNDPSKSTNNSDATSETGEAGQPGSGGNSTTTNPTTPGATTPGTPAAPAPTTDNPNPAGSGGIPASSPAATTNAGSGGSKAPR